MGQKISRPFSRSRIQRNSINEGENEKDSAENKENSSIEGVYAGCMSKPTSQKTPKVKKNNTLKKYFFKKKVGVKEKKEFAKKKKKRPLIF